MKPVGEHAFMMNLLYTILSFISIAACIGELCGYTVTYVEAILSLMVLRLAVRLCDFEMSLEAGYDRQFFGLIILSNSLVAQMSLTLLFVFFPFSYFKLLNGMMQAFFVGGCAVYGLFKLIGEVNTIKPVSIAILLCFPMLMLTAMLMMKGAEDQWRVQIDKIHMENEFHYVLDLLQESIAIVDDSKLNDTKEKAFEYVNNCFLANFKNIIEECANNSSPHYRFGDKQDDEIDEVGTQQPKEKIRIYDQQNH